MTDAVMICADPMQSVIMAQPLRRAGVCVRTHLSGNIKKQFARSTDVKILVIVRNDATTVKNTVTGEQQPLVGDIVKTVRECGL